MAGGGRPRQHDARPRRAHRRRARSTERALQFFTPDEIAEAFAATRGVASPTQLRSVMKQDGRDLSRSSGRSRPRAARSRCNAGDPPRSCYALVLVRRRAVRRQPGGVRLFTPAELTRSSRQPDCGTERPDGPHGAVGAVGDVGAVRRRAAGRLGAGAVSVRQDRAPFWLNSDQGGHHAVEVVAAPARRVRRSAARPRCRATRSGCVASSGPSSCRRSCGARASTCSTAAASPTASRSRATRARRSIFDADTALAFQPRDTLVDKVRGDSDLSLCGADAPPCPGGS